MPQESTGMMPSTTIDTGAVVPKPPQGMEPAALTEAEQTARTLVDRLMADPDDLKTLSDLTRLGEEAQRKVGGFLEMRKATVGEMMKKVSDGTHNPLPNHIRRMRSIMEKFDPRPFREQLELAGKYGGKGVKNLLARKMRGIPLIGDLLQNIADKFKPVSDEIDNLLVSMEGGLVRLDENNAAILTQSDELKLLIAEVALRAYEAELVFAKLKERHAQADAGQKPKIMNAMSRVGKRTLFLRGNEQIFLQVLTGLRTSITTNFELRDTVSMLRDQAAPLLTNLYALIVVQQDARQIAEAAAATQEMVTDLLREGAEMTRDNVEYVGSLGVRMLTEMDKLMEAKSIFLDAVAKADRIAEQTVEAASKGLPMLQEASDQLRRAVSEHEGADAIVSQPK